MEVKNFVSIIIPVKEVNDYILEALPHLVGQSYKDFEIIILPNFLNEKKIKNDKIKIIVSGEVGPAEKRDLGVEKSRGEIIAFVDDDAYPKDKKWLENAVLNFKDKKIGAIGGPNLTPPKNSLFQKTNGAVLSSYMVSGPAKRRYMINGRKEVDDLPSCNFFIRKKLFDKIGGFDSKFWPGEDTKLCRDIINEEKKIIYDPKVVVYHHRRKNLSAYVKQIFSYSTHRGYFMKKIPENSLKISYFVPTLFLIGLIEGFLLSFLNPVLKIVYISILLIYLILLVIEAIKTKDIRLMFGFILLAFLTHIVYGLGLLNGLLKGELKK